MLLFLLPTAIFSHCELPCGIYSDKMRIEMLKEHITTIEKSMKMIKELESASSINYNQLVRWVNNKDEHANEFQKIISQYFMTQRIKLADPSDNNAVREYHIQLELLHQMLVYAMKTKQAVNLDTCEKLRSLIDNFYSVYFSEEEKHHQHK